MVSSTYIFSGTLLLSSDVSAAIVHHKVSVSTHEEKNEGVILEAVASVST